MLFDISRKKNLCTLSIRENRDYEKLNIEKTQFRTFAFSVLCELCEIVK